MAVSSFFVFPAQLMFLRNAENARCPAPARRHLIYFSPAHEQHCSALTLRPRVIHHCNAKKEVMETNASTGGADGETQSTINVEGSGNIVDKLPPEVTFNVFRLLEARDIARTAAVCKRWSESCRDVHLVCQSTPTHTTSLQQRAQQ